jgi:putative peptidoglycan lipid II flippase
VIGRGSTGIVAEESQPEAAVAAPDATKERAALTRNAGIVAAGTLVSRVLGAGRDAVFAACFPVAATDAFFVAFTIPNALRGLLADGAVSSAFIPTYTEVRTKEGEAKANDFYARLSGAMLVVLALVSVIGVATASLFVTAYAGGYADDPELFATTVSLTRIVFPYIFFMGAAALGTGILNAHRHFAVPAVAPALLNVALIAAPFVLVGPAAALGLPPIASLALGAIVGGVLQMIAQWPAIRSLGLLTMPIIDFRDARVRDALARLGPLALGLGIYQVNVMLARLLTSYLPSGSQSYLYYGQRLVEIPQGMFALAIASAALPTLADLRSRGENDELRRVFAQAMRSSLFVGVPATAILMALAEPTVAVLFQRGAFDHHDALETTRSLAWQGAGVWAIACVRVVVPMFYAHGDTKTPLVGSAINLAVFVGLGVWLRTSMGHAGIAIAISAAGVAQLAVLLLLLRRKLGRLGLGSVAGAALRTTLAALALSGVGIGVARFGHWERGGNDLVNLAVLAAALIAGGLAYLAVLAAFRAPELADVTAALRRRVKRRG